MKIFPYQKNSSGDFFPLIDIFVYNKNYASRIFALVDSGAAVSIFRKDVADQLNLKIETGRETYLGGVGGRIKGYVHELKIEVVGKRFLCPIVFSYEYSVSFSLLGREGFFKRFKIIFEEKKNYLKLE